MLVVRVQKIAKEQEENLKKETGVQQEVSQVRRCTE
jgi:hypothetical protein